MRWGWVVVGMMVAAAPADGDALRGTAEVQYQKLSRAGGVRDVESWLSSFQSDYSRSIRSVQLWSQFQISEQHFTARPDRTLSPQGSLRLAHPLFGIFATHRPSRSTDARSITSRQNETMVSAYVQKAGLPQVNGSWSRNHLDPGTGLPGAVVITRSLTSQYDIGRLALRAGYGDLTNDAAADRAQRSRQQHLDLGAGTELSRGRATGGFHYDFSQTRRQAGTALMEISRLHTAAVNGGMRFSERTSSSLGYNFRHSSGGRLGSSDFDEHDGSLILSHRLAQGVQVSSGGGVRSAALGQRVENEGYVLASLSADLLARPGWRVGGGASHSLNWLPNEHGRPIDVVRASTGLQLARGLDVGGDLSLAMSRPQTAPGDTVTRSRETTTQGGVSLRAVPIRALTVNASARGFRPPASVVNENLATTTYSAGADWRVTSRILLTGTWGLTDAPSSRVPDQTLVRTTAEWNARRFQTNVSYARIGQRAVDPTRPAAQDRESFTAWLALGLTRALRTTVQYNAIDWGRPTRVRQVSATVTQSFGR